MRIRLILGSLVMVGLVLSACSGQREEPVRVPPEPAPLEEPSRVETAVANAANEYSGTMRGLNGSSVRGEVRISVDDEVVRVTVVTRGLDPTAEYSVRVHGFRDGRLAQGPPEADSVNQGELNEVMGPALLTVVPSARPSADGALDVRARKTGSRAFPLDIRGIVIAQVRRRDTPGPEPVAYALLRPAELGDNGVGGPGEGSGQGGAGPGGGGTALPGAGTGGAVDSGQQPGDSAPEAQNGGAGSTGAPDTSGSQPSASGGE